MPDRIPTNKFINNNQLALAALLLPPAVQSHHSGSIGTCGMPWGRLENGSNGSNGFRKDPDSRNAGLLVCSGIGIFSGTSSDVMSAI